MKKQILVIHGGDTFETYEEYLSFLQKYTIESLDYFTDSGWKKSLQESVGNDYEVISPRMPNKNNAKYLEWKMWFEKIIPLLNGEVIVIGHSLGGIFLAKYLSENKLSKKILGAFLVAAPYDSTDADYSLADFILPENLALFRSQVGKIFLYHSRDDYVVPFTDVEKYKSQLPEAVVQIFDDRGHFNQETFTELTKQITALVS